MRLPFFKIFNKNYQKGIIHLLPLLLIIIGLGVGLYLVQSKDLLNLKSKAGNDPIVIKDENGSPYPKQGGNSYQVRSPKIKIEITSTLGPPSAATSPTNTSTTTQQLTFTPEQPTTFGLTVKARDGYKASDLVREINQNFKPQDSGYQAMKDFILAVRGHDSNSNLPIFYNPINPQQPDNNDFPIKVGEGYIIDVRAPGSSSIQGQALIAPINVDILRRRSLVSFPALPDTIKTAADLVSELKRYDIRIGQVEKATPDSQPYIIDRPNDNNFPIAPGTAYYLNNFGEAKQWIIRVVSAPSQSDTAYTRVPGCSVCNADINTDGNVNITDFSLLSSCYRQSGTGRCLNADINMDGTVDALDYGCLAGKFGQQCTARLGNSSSNPNNQVNTIKYKVAENPADLRNAPEVDYAAEPTVIDYEFKGVTASARKYLFIEFIANNGRRDVKQITVDIQLPRPTPTTVGQPPTSIPSMSLTRSGSFDLMIGNYSQPINGTINIDQQNRRINLTCKLGEQNCSFTATYIAKNRTDKTLYSPAIWVDNPILSNGSRTNMLQYTNFNGTLTSDRSTSDRRVESGQEVINTAFRVTPPQQVGTYISNMYIDAKTCNNNINPPDCTFYGASSFAVSVTVNSDTTAPTPTPTNTPTPTIRPTNTPTPVAQTKDIHLIPTSASFIKHAKLTDGTQGIRVNNNQFNTQDFTIEGWFKLTSPREGSMYLLRKRESTTLPYNDTYAVMISSYSYANEISLRVMYQGNTEVARTANVFGDGKWHHVALVNTSNNQTASLFIDGKKKTSIAHRRNLIYGNGDLYIGSYSTERDSNSFNFFNGSVDEVRLSKNARYANDFYPSYFPFTSDANTLGLWHFDGNYKDSSNNLADATSFGTIQFINSNIQPEYSSPIYPMSGFGNALKFDSNGYIKATQTQTIGKFSNLTLDAWVYIRDGGSGPIIAKKLGSSADGSYAYSLAIDYQRKIKFVYSVLYNNKWVPTELNTTATVDPNKWNLISIVYNNVPQSADQGKLSIYLNGQRVTQTNITGEIGGGSENTYGADVLIGTDPSMSQTFNGAIDEIRINRGVNYLGDNVNIPNSPFSSDTTTVLLCHFDEGQGNPICTNSSGNQVQTTTSNIGYLR